METKLLICPVCGGTLCRKAAQYICESCGAIQDILVEEQADIPQETWREAAMLLAEARKITENSGLIQLKLAAGYCSELEVTRSLSLPCGYASPRYAGDAAPIPLFDPHILTVTGKNTIYNLLPVFEEILTVNQANPETPLLFFTDQMDDKLLDMLVINWERGNFKCLAVCLPVAGPERDTALDTVRQLGCRILDCAAVSSSFRMQDLGSVRQVLVASDKTFLIDKRLPETTPIVTIYTGGTHKKGQEQLLLACQNLNEQGDDFHV